MADALGRLATLIRQLQGALGGRTIRDGSVTVSFSGSDIYSNVATVDHDLGTIPASITVTGRHAVGDADILVADVYGDPTDESFAVVACYPKFVGNPTARARTVYWRASG